ncbi:ABC transporter permease subunit [Acuticoccus kandeliae]|uniref:ABC transporter permease subunit n=1 Tax=Acuticoccus kandeliae TaxID=2073160 RepID=UPI000D3E262C|nr:ABC transporter permease subunit [Acuticoccus kandeliae]
MQQPPPPARRRPDWPGIVVVAFILVAAGTLVFNIELNMRAAGMTPGYGFLAQTAGFDLNESLTAYRADDTYAQAILAGLVNTIVLAAAALVLATVLGVLMALVSVSSSPPGRALALVYVEVFRNLPKILVLLVLYVVAVQGLPPVREALSLGPVHLSNRSLYLPMIEPRRAQLWLLLPVAACALGSAWIWMRARRVKRDTGREWPVAPLIVGTMLVGPALFAWAAQIPLPVSVPRLERFDYVGGARMSVQFVVVLVTLGIYHGAQIAEVVRGGILAIPSGQVDAARSLGLSPRQATRFVVLPQVLRIVIPPMINQYVNLIKNTSIAIAVGYSDLMSVSSTIINQTFRPLEIMLVTMALYLALCLIASTALNRLNDALRARFGSNAA